MAPEPSNHKRKRGRPPNASRQEEADASQNQDRRDAAAAAVPEEHGADIDEEKRPRKQRRPRKSTEPVAEETAAPRDPEPGRRRGRPLREGKAKATATATQAAVEDEEVAPRAKRKRGRPSLSNTEAGGEPTEGGGPSSRRGENTAADGQTRAHQDAESQAGPRERRGKKRAVKNQQQQEEEEEEPRVPEPSPRQRRGRRPPPQGRQEVEENTEPAREQRQNPRKRDRPSLQDMPPAEVRDKASNNGKGGKGGKGGRASKADETTIVEDVQAKKKGGERRRPSGGGEASMGDKEAPQAVPEAESQAGPAESSPGRKKKQRHRFSQNAAPEDDDAPPSPPSPPKPYPHIAPQVRRVRQSTIEAKWSPLAEPSLSAASAILHLAHRPILQRLSNTQQRRTHTSAALRLVTHRITRKVARGLPFPPASLTGRAPRRSGRGAGVAAAVVGGGGDNDGRAAELNFESVLDAMQALERQLDPALHAVELLTREKEKLERELERDYEALRNLETSARAQAREHRGLLKKAHVLAPTPEAVVLQRKEKQKRDVIFRHDGTWTAGEGLLDDLEDDGLKPLALQLGDHVESIKNNLQQTDGIVPQLAHTRAALLDVLFRYIDQGQYEHVLLG